MFGSPSISAASVARSGSSLGLLHASATALATVPQSGQSETCTQVDAMYHSGVFGSIVGIARFSPLQVKTISSPSRNSAGCSSCPPDFHFIGRHSLNRTEKLKRPIVNPKGKEKTEPQYS